MSIPDPEKKTSSVIIAMSEGDEYDMFAQLLGEVTPPLKIEHVTSGHRALLALEETNPDFLIMDVQLSDIHGWELLGKLREISNLRDLPVIVVADHGFVAPAIGPVICLTRPISRARLRQSVMDVLNSG
jgi:CheY-like chemotaxis protein